MNRNDRETLNKLSKEVFGSSSKWQKLVNDGFVDTMTRDREAMIPSKNGPLQMRTFVDKKLVNRRYTVEEVTQLMLDVLKKRNEDRANAGNPISESISKKIVEEFAVK